MYKLAYVIPTKNRADYLDKCLEAFRNSFLKFNVAVYIIDASDDDESLKVCEKYKTDGDGIVFEKMPGTSLPYRFFHAFNSIDAEYICLGRDRLLPTYEGAEFVMKLLEKDYDMLNFSMENFDHISDEEYNNISEIPSSFVIDSLFFGSIFLRKSAYQLTDCGKFQRIYTDNAFFYVIYYFNYLFNKDSFKAFYCTNLFPYIKKYISDFEDSTAQTHWWNTEEKLFKTWCRDLVQMVNWLEILNDKKKKKILSFGCVIVGMSSTRNVIKLREDGLLNKSNYKKYEPYISEIAHISNLDPRIIHVISVIPPIFCRFIGFVMDLHLYLRLRIKIKSFVVKHSSLVFLYEKLTRKKLTAEKTES